MPYEDAIARQRAYYSENAEAYDAGWSGVRMNRVMPYMLLSGAIQVLGAESLLDVGAGSGRLIRMVRQLQPTLRMVGVEPSAELRRVGHAAGIAEADLIDGDGYALPFADDAFDVVCELGALHHVAEPPRVVAEMCRVAKKAVFIADTNNFGQGSRRARQAKQMLHRLGLWHRVDLVKTGGKGYRVSEGDGISYSYSVFDNVQQLEGLCQSVHSFNLDGSARDPYRAAGHVALFGILTDRVAGLTSI